MFKRLSRGVDIEHKNKKGESVVDYLHRLLYDEAHPKYSLAWTAQEFLKGRMELVVSAEGQKQINWIRDVIQAPRSWRNLG
jgi:hypothetical protein